MARKQDVEREMRDLLKKKLSLSQLHELSIKIAGGILKTNPINYAAEAKKSYELQAVKELIYNTKLKNNEQKHSHRFDREYP